MPQLTKWITIGQEGLELIKEFEGFSPTVYKCSANKSTIGYGHLILPKEKFTTITKEDATTILQKDLKLAVDSVNVLVDIELTLNQFSALVSFVYNLGGGSFASSTLRDVVNKGLHLDVPEQFIKWKKAAGKPLKGLLLRRLAEASLYLS